MRIDTDPSGTSAPARDLSRIQFVAALLLVVLAALVLRSIYPVADPPTAPPVGIVWHDEGGWVHNARNRALFGVWKLDEWNPMYVTPVLTGLEYGTFAVLGVGLRQARLVPELLGALSVLLMGLGVARIAGRRAGVFAAVLLATNFVYVMYGRVATLEGSMAAFLVVAWYGYARAQRSPRWGLMAGAAAIAAYFTKASAVFFVVSLAFDALLSLLPSRAQDSEPADGISEKISRRAGTYTLAGLAAAGLVALVAFVWPAWRDYRFYNWQLSVTRKPSYSPRAFADRASQLPVVGDFFTRMWLVLVVAVSAALARLAVLRRIRPAERLLVWWLALGIAELIVHDVQERRLLVLVPAMVGLAAVALGRCRLAASDLRRVPQRRVWLAAPLLFYGIYVVSSALIRVPFLYRVAAGEHPAPIVRTSAVLSAVFCVALCAGWRHVSAWLTSAPRLTIASSLVVALVVAGDVLQFAQWASARTYKNYDAMVLIGKWLPDGTLVHGKLANGLALESRIRPMFVGCGFGNYNDRATRDDIRYVATYSAPFVGYEGGRACGSGQSVIWDVLNAYPHREVVHLFDVAESPGGHDAAVLIDKRPWSR